MYLWSVDTNILRTTFAIADALGGRISGQREGMDLEQISGGIEAHKQLSGRDGGQDGVWILFLRRRGRYDR